MTTTEMILSRLAVKSQGCRNNATALFAFVFIF